MTALRNEFAAAALTGIMANPERWKDIARRYEAGEMSYNHASISNAVKAWNIADAMLAVLHNPRVGGESFNEYFYRVEGEMKT